MPARNAPDLPVRSIKAGIRRKLRKSRQNANTPRLLKEYIRTNYPDYVLRGELFNKAIKEMVRKGELTELRDGRVVLST